MADDTVTKNKVISMHYTLRDDQGETIDSSEGEEPLSFLFGSGEIVDGLESALDGKRIGDRVEAVVPPQTAYGERVGDGPKAVPRDEFPPGVELHEGMCFDVEDDDGHTETYWIAELDEEIAHIDINHPLAGMTLHFDVEITAIREPTAEELDHGHAH
jgi:FKBP-type peptidyl-prolyl cis-trans isomerase SlyD